ncbi:MAG: hypothetical protein QNJ54_06615 [Prochloraceae cyanobacterium]|nr:hypothetical protein [Prochloraceae cyanobacterium]
MFASAFDLPENDGKIIHFPGSPLLFKTESIANFLELLRKKTIEKKTIGTELVTASMSPRTSDNGTYYAVEFTSTPNKPEQIKTLKAFLESNSDPRSGSRRARIYSARLAENQKQLPATNN